MIKISNINSDSIGVKNQKSTPIQSESKIKNQLRFNRSQKSRIKKDNSGLTCKIHLDSGQIVLMLVLLTMVGLTIGLSLISRTVTDVRISSQIEQSSRAFSAAEAGVETALRSVAVITPGQSETISLDEATAFYQVSDISGSSQVYSMPLTSVGEAQTVWLASHNSDGSLDESNTYPVNSNLTLCWGSSTDNNPAVVLTIFYKDSSSDEYKIAKAAYDSTSRSNGFELVGPAQSGDCGGGFRFKKVFSAENDFGLTVGTDKLLILRIQAVYASTSLAIDPDGNLPVQGKLINSLGRTDTGVVRKMQVIQGYDVLPMLLDFTLFTENEE